MPPKTSGKAAAMSGKAIANDDEKKHKGKRKGVLCHLHLQGEPIESRLVTYLHPLQVLKQVHPDTSLQQGDEYHNSFNDLRIAAEASKLAHYNKRRPGNVH